MNGTELETERMAVWKALAIFAVSRAVILLAILFAATRIPPPSTYGTWNVGAGWWHWLLRWDSGYYLSIAQNGYTYDGDSSHFQTVVFFPGYPILIRGLALVCGVGFPQAAVVASNLCSLGAILLLFQLVKRHWDAGTATATVAVVSFFPASLFLSAAYSEGPALLLTVLFFTLLLNRRFMWAAVCAGCISAARPTGVLLTLPMVFEIWSHFKRRVSLRFLSCAAAATAAACSGLLAFSAYCWIRFQDPLLFIHARGAWALGRTEAPGAVAWNQVTAGVSNAIWPNYSDPWIFIGCAALLGLGWKRLPVSMRVYSVATLLFLVVARVFGPEGFTSANRYLLLLFPCFIALACYLRDRIWLLVPVVAGMAVFLFMYSALFVQWYWAG
jgi:hypothetical protein